MAELEWGRGIEKFGGGGKRQSCLYSAQLKLSGKSSGITKVTPFSFSCSRQQYLLLKPLSPRIHLLSFHLLDFFGQFWSCHELFPGILTCLLPCQDTNGEWALLLYFTLQSGWIPMRKMDSQWRWCRSTMEHPKGESTSGPSSIFFIYIYKILGVFNLISSLLLKKILHGITEWNTNLGKLNCI